MATDAFRTVQEFADELAVIRQICDNLDNADVPDLAAKRDFAEKARIFHSRCAWSENGTISSSWGECYPKSRQMLFRAIMAAYPTTDIEAVYDTWVDCSEDIKYCAKYVQTDMLHKLHKRNFCRTYHIQCNPDHCYMGDEMPKDGEIYRNGDEWSAGN